MAGSYSAISAFRQPPKGDSSLFAAATDLRRAPIFGLMAPGRPCKLSKIFNAQGILEGLETIRKIFRIDRREIAFLRFIFEGCDGVAQLTTLDRKAGIVAVRIPPGCQRDVEQVLEGLSGEILMEPI